MDIVNDNKYVSNKHIVQLILSSTIILVIPTVIFDILSITVLKNFIMCRAITQMLFVC